MHSSRMAIWGGGLAKGEVSAQGGVCLEGVCLGGVSVQGVSAYGGCLSKVTPPVNRITDRCENITFPQLLLRTVKINIST